MDECEIVKIFADVPVMLVTDWVKQGKNTKMPYAVLNHLYNFDVAADNINYVTRERWQLDLYTKERDRSLETQIETALRKRGLFYARESETDNDADYSQRTGNYFRAIYRFTTLGGSDA